MMEELATTQRLGKRECSLDQKACLRIGDNRRRTVRLSAQALIPGGQTTENCHAEIHQPVIAMVPVGDWFTMGSEVAALAVQRYFKLKAVIPCHYGSFPMLEPNAERFVAAMEGKGTQVIVPQKNRAVRF